MTAVMIGVDPHEASHTAVAISAAEEPLGEVRVRASAAQVDRLHKNDPNDARSVAVAALRSPGVKEARADDHAAVLRVWAKRHRDLGRTRTQIVCRLHAVLCELIPGGVPKAIIAARAGQLLETITPSGPVEAARWELAAEFLEDLRHIDTQLEGTRRKLATVVRASGTSLTGLFGGGSRHRRYRHRRQP